MKEYRVEIGCHIFSTHDTKSDAVAACKRLAARGTRAYVWSMAAKMIVYRNW